MAGPIHATAVDIRGAGVLLVGPSGSGKSDLAMRLIDRGATLVADDRVLVRRAGAELHLSAPPTIVGLIEVRGVGILARPIVDTTVARLVVDLVRRPDRLPEPDVHLLQGVSLPLLALDAFEASAPIKVEWALAHLLGAG